MEQGIKCTELDDNWFFFKDDKKIYKNIRASTITTIPWRSIKVPHDWDIEGPFLEKNKSGSAGGYAPCGLGWYYKSIKFEPEDKNSKFFLNFDGIYMRATIWLNDQLVGTHLYGYSPFELDITPYIDYDQTNILIIKVDNSKQPSCRWYSGSGIYRKVFLIQKSPVYISNGGFFINTPQVSDKNATINIETEIVSEQNVAIDVEISTTLLDDHQNQIECMSEKIKVTANSTYNLKQQINLDTPHLWSVDDPYLYSIETQISSTPQDQLLDRVATSVGLRYYKYDQNGFWLNGKNIKMKGVCIHHDGGCVGAAVPVKVWERRLKVLRSIGCNAIRTSHNPPASDFLDVCDKMGFLVIDEAFDKWVNPSPRHDWVIYGFRKFWKQELSNFIKRDRNHPSVILWSIGNETRRAYRKSSKKWLQKLYNVVKALDPYRLVTVVLSPSDAQKESLGSHSPRYGDLVDVIATNYSEAHFPAYHERWPEKAMISTEAYHYWRRKAKRELDIVSKPGYKNYTEQNPWFEIMKYSYAVGLFLWVGIEYLGEVRDPYPYHGRTNAPIRITGYPKPQARFLQSIWLEQPFVHATILDNSADIPRGKLHFDYPKIVCHWNFENHNQRVFDIFTYTNCESVELLLNGKSMGEKNSQDYPNHDMKWTVPYESGELMSIGKNHGVEVTRSILMTSQGPKQINLIPDNTTLQADGHDCAHIDVQIVDEKGILYPHANNRLNISIEGEGELIGLDSGNLAAHDSYKENQCSVYWGQALIIVQATKKPGKITICVESEGFSKQSIEIQTFYNN